MITNVMTIKLEVDIHPSSSSGNSTYLPINKIIIINIIIYFEFSKLLCFFNKQCIIYRMKDLYYVQANLELKYV